jgi:hypothetical protein
VQKAKSNTKATILGSFFQSLDLDTRLGGCGIRGIDYLFFRKYSKSKQRRLKTNLTLSLILQFNLRLRGYSIWSAIIHRTPYKRKNSGHEHLIALMQIKDYSKRNFKTELRKKSKTASEVLEEPAVLSYEELGGLSGIDPLGTARKLPES